LKRGRSRIGRLRLVSYSELNLYELGVSFSTVITLASRSVSMEVDSKPVVADSNAAGPSATMDETENKAEVEAAEGPKPTETSEYSSFPFPSPFVQ
jgi:hypothetical protein